MNYEKFCKILNKHIFEGEKKELLRRIAGNPERFIGLFRPTKPEAKILQHLLQSHEIRMGDALEEIIEEILSSLGFKIISKGIVNESGETLSLDQYFTDGEAYYFIEQKVRDDHDSTKKRGQISNFETKLEILHKKHSTALFGIMYFIDPDLSKNKNYYLQELGRLEKFYGIKLDLFYGRELFEYLKHPEIWDNILSWLKRWKEGLPELPEINFDTAPEESFGEIKDLELRNWREILENEILWKEGIIKAMFRKGTTLRLLLGFFKKQRTTPYEQLTNILTERLKEYYGNETK
ncbi:HpyAIV family type II restriction enzyme [Caldisericum sp.]|uniref:HpyAIV family type II restriction enzyme n=1 Tax=Caldisericum sp. TaxID=2499687 RepID=UPI003D0E3619